MATWTFSGYNNGRGAAVTFTYTAAFDPATMQMGLRVTCGKGTYIRALARDLGRALGSGAYLTSLRRTRVGDYTVDNCVDYDHFQEWLDNQEIEKI